MVMASQSTRWMGTRSCATLAAWSLSHLQFTLTSMAEWRHLLPSMPCKATVRRRSRNTPCACSAPNAKPRHSPPRHLSSMRSTWTTQQIMREHSPRTMERSWNSPLTGNDFSYQTKENEFPCSTLTETALSQPSKAFGRITHSSLIAAHRTMRNQERRQQALLQKILKKNLNPSLRSATAQTGT